MAKRSTYTPNPERRAIMERATDAGLIAGAQVVVNDVRLRFRARKAGYTTGAFAHPGRGVSASITRNEPHDFERLRRVQVGTNQRSDAGAAYPLFWEVGHQNLFTGKFERVETFRPALFDNADRVRAAFARAYAVVMASAEESK